jgi:hypothetical protein
VSRTDPMTRTLAVMWLETLQTKAIAAAEIFPDGHPDREAWNRRTNITHYLLRLVREDEEREREGG